MISENVTLLACVKSCQAECPTSFSLSVRDGKPLKQALNLKPIGYCSRHLRKGVKFFREQTPGVWCLTERLSGNRQKPLAAPIPAPGGIQ